MTEAADLQLVTSRLIAAAPQRLSEAACLDRLAGYLSARPALSPP